MLIIGVNARNKALEFILGAMSRWEARVVQFNSIQLEFQWNPRSGSSFHCFQVELEFENVGFCGGRKTGVPGENPQSKDENQQQTQPTYDAESGNRTRATLVGGECSHHCTIPAPLFS